MRALDLAESTTAGGGGGGGGGGAPFSRDILQVPS